MKKSIMFIGALLMTSSVFGQTDINDARTNYSVGQTVTIKGVSADDGELGPIRYIQDATGGLPVYGGASVGSINRGDSVEVTGELKDFYGLLEIDPIANVNNYGPGIEIDPWVISISDMGETFEGRLLQFDDITFPDAGGTFSGATNYDFTDGTNTGEFRIQTGSDLVGMTIPSGPQTLIGLGSQFNSTYQVLPRDAADIFDYVAPDKKIVIEVDGTSFLNGNTAYIGTTTSTPITIKNIGVNDLTISAVDITGGEAADFSTDITTGPIAGGSQSNNTLTFTPSGNGSRQAILEIESDDPDDPNYIINLYAIGNDGLATEPVTGPTALNFSNVKAYTMNASYTSTPDAESYLVVWKKGSAPTGAPTDGETYMRGDVVGDGQVAYVGSGSSFTPRGIRADIDYHFDVYAFNGYDTYTNYNQTDMISGNQTSEGEQIGTYYNGIDSQSASFLDDLTGLINPHDYNSYFLYKTIVMDQFEVRDTVNGESFVKCVYTGERKVFSGPFDWTATGYSREHTYAHSWMPTHPADNPEELEYADYHNLYPTNLSEANSPRSNLPFGVITGEVVYEYLDGRVGKIADGSYVYEPREDQKGNLARSIFYMATAYNGVNGTGDNWSIPSNQNQAVLKDWHFSDLPDSYEIARQELIFDAQDNRNPFVDSVDYVCYIDFSQMEYDVDACALSLDENVVEDNLAMFPNPSNDKVYIQVNGIDIDEVEVKDMTGRTVLITNNSPKAVELNVSDLKAGSYIVNVKTTYGTSQRKLIVQ
ncbi:MAG: endonuclease [Brumimicrobium sp.]